jgi:hypothetical protein
VVNIAMKEIAEFNDDLLKEFQNNMPGTVTHKAHQDSFIKSIRENGFVQ